MYFQLEIVKLVREIRQPPLRPNLGLLDGLGLVMKELQRLAAECWHETPSKRPSSVTIHRTLQRVIGKRKDGLVEELLGRAAGYAEELENLVGARTHELHAEKHKIQALLFEILPRQVSMTEYG